MLADVEQGVTVAITKTCRDCKKIFVLGRAELHYPIEPVRCQSCRAKRRMYGI